MRFDSGPPGALEQALSRLEVSFLYIGVSQPELDGGKMFRVRSSFEADLERLAQRPNREGVTTGLLV